MTKKIWLAMTLLYPRAKRVVAVSQQMRACLEQRAKLNNVKCIYNPIDIPLIQKKSLLPIPNQVKKFILGVGRLERQKRFDRLITAYAQTRLQQECNLIIVGSGSQAVILKQQIHDLGLEDKALLIGFDDNPYKYMAKAQFQVMSSDYEGYPLVLIEALSLGCPIISTDCPTGPREIIQPYLNGLLVDLNAEALTEAMDQLYYDNALLNQLKINAAHSVSTNHIQLIADEWLAA
jgi:glycosyltransferase involved in cell wall biosynthesis